MLRSIFEALGLGRRAATKEAAAGPMDTPPVTVSPRPLPLPPASSPLRTESTTLIDLASTSVEILDIEEGDTWAVVDAPLGPVEITEASWQHHEPDLDYTKKLDDRFYNELSTHDVATLLICSVKAKGRPIGREHLRRATEAAYKRRAQSPEARALAEMLLVRLVRETKPKLLNATDFVWRAKMLEEQGAFTQAIECLQSAIDRGLEDRSQRGLGGRIATLHRKAQREG